MRFCYSLFVCLTLLAPLVRAQPPHSLVRMHTELGRMLFDTYQDRLGYIWICSSAGVAKYNGTRFKYYTQEDGLSDLDVFSLFEDKQDRLWALTFNGLPSYFKDNRWYNSSTTKWLQSLSGQGSMQSMLQKGDTVVLAAEKKLFLLAANQTVLGISVTSMSNESSQIRGMVEAFGQLIVLTDAGFFTYPARQFTPLPTGIRFPNQNTKLIKWMGMFVVSHNREVYLFDQQFKLIRSISTPRKGLVLRLATKTETNAVSTNQASLLVCADEGVYQMRDTNSRTLLKYYPNELLWPSSWQVDRDGHVWVTSLTEGLYFGERNPPRAIPINPTMDTDLPSSLLAEPGRFWVGTEAGYIFLSDRFSAKAEPVFRSVFQAPYSESFKRVRQFLPQSKKMLVGLDGALVTIDRATLRTSMIPGVSKSVLTSGDDSLLIARSDRLMKRSIPGHGIEIEQTSKANERLVLEARVNAMLSANKDSLWVGTTKGLKILVRDRLTDLPIELNQLRMSITALEPVSAHAMLIGTRADGLWYRNGSSLLRISDGGRDKAQVNQIRKSSVDSTTWWIATNAGLKRVRIKPPALPVLEDWSARIAYRNQVISVAEYAGWLWCATDAGLIRYSILDTLQPGPAVLLEQIQVNDSDYVVSTSHPLRLGYNQNRLLIRFTSFCFSKSSQPTFRYRLMPGQTAWQMLEESTLRFDQLAPGEYFMEIQAQHPGTGFGPSTRMNFVIMLPWWKTWWFRMIALLGLILVVGLIARSKWRKLQQANAAAQIRAEQIKEELILRHKLLQKQQEAEKAQLTPHFLFNAIYALQGFYGAGKIDQGKAYAEKFTEVLRQQLRIAGKEKLTLRDEVVMLTHYVHWRNMKRQHPVNLVFEWNESIDDFLLIPTMLIQPLIENCFDHAFDTDSPDQKITINLEPNREEKWILVSVSDNGVGFHATRLSKASAISEEKSNNKGITLVKNRLELLGILAWGSKSRSKQLFAIVDAGTGKGCTILLTIPCSFEADEEV